MSIRTDAYVLNVGDEQDLEINQGEDRRYVFSWKSNNAAIDFTGWTALKLTVRDSQGILVFARDCDQQPPAGTTPSFTLVQLDTAALPPQPYSVDVQGFDGTGLRTTLTRISRFECIQVVGQNADPITTPPAIPVVYGLRWLGAWSALTAYLVNDAVQYPDPNGGASDALSSFRCRVPNTNVPPLDGMGALSADWQYIAERGADGISAGDQKGRAAFVAAGATFVDITFPNGYAFPGAYSIEATVFNSDAGLELITVNVTLRPGDPGPAPAPDGFRLQVSIDFDGFVSWRAY